MPTMVHRFVTAYEIGPSTLAEWAEGGWIIYSAHTDASGLIRFDLMRMEVSR